MAQLYNSDPQATSADDQQRNAIIRLGANNIEALGRLDNDSA